MFTNIKECIHWIETQQRKTTKTLTRMKEICAVFNNPQNKFLTIHVAGTNGKGSVVAYLKAILKENNLNVATFTSPYIECFNERIQINDNFISDDDILKYSNFIVSKYDILTKKNIETPSFFEFITILAFLYFQDKDIDVAIFEVGIGGLLDSTNVIMPILSIITNISYDHMEILGNTLEEIAINKLGIVKKGVPLVTIENKQLENLIINHCKENLSPLTIVKKEDIKNIDVAIDHTTFDYLTYSHVKLNMLGRYQTENAAIAIEACQYLQKYFPLSLENCYVGLEEMFWPGRLEVICKKPITIIDGAHNIDGITRLEEFIKDIKKSYLNKKIVLIMAISSNKETKKMIQEIEKCIDEIILTKFNYRRSDEAINLYNSSNHPNKRKVENIDDVIKEITNDEFIYIFSGSLYFISEIRQKMKVNN